MRLNKQISDQSKLWSREGDADRVGGDRLVGLLPPGCGPDLDPGPTCPTVSGCRSQQISHAHRIVGRRGPGEHPADSRQAAKVRLAHQRHGFEPAKHFFHPLAFCLTHRVARMAGGALINRTAAPPSGVLRHMGVTFNSRSDATCWGRKFTSPPKVPQSAHLACRDVTLPKGRSAFQSS